MKPFTLLFVLLLTAHAQQTSSSIPPPKQILGYELGDRFSSHARIERYILAIRDAASDRVRVIPYGETYEGRTLYLVVVSSPENLNHLDDIKANIHKLSDPRATSDGEAERIIGSSPAIAWLSYGVHGNEASSPEAALSVLYQLASRTDAEMMTLLKNLVVVIDPLLNPDGHERYVNYETTRSGVKPIDDKNAVEHNEDWPSGRTNHYFFDLNRDWAWLTQRESQARIMAYQEWKPQVHVDFHEMGYNSSYFFFPAFKPINKNFPKNTVEWGEIYGRANAAAFDKQGWSYWSGESFDLFYPGYGDSWPSLNGAIGMTYEQAGQVGVSVKRSDETILTLKDRLEHHAATSLATLKATADNREKRLRDFYQFFKQAISEGISGPVKAFIVNPAKDPSRAAKMISLLSKQGVEISQAQREFSVDGLSTYFSKTTTSKQFPPGSYIIPLSQPAKRLIMSLMEQEP
ncbi:MAG: peptidase M14, partial [Ignavibacteria bacterium]|nr:peptidase M14 [Ignavibacteria bacterium]